MAVCYENKRLPIPDTCLPEFRQVMTDCWHNDPEKRPNFKDIIAILQGQKPKDEV
jgi:hypothetical protein